MIEFADDEEGKRINGESAVAWEYIVLGCADELADGSPTIKILNEELDKASRKGWELVAIVEVEPKVHRYFFKRPKRRS